MYDCNNGHVVVVDYDDDDTDYLETEIS